MQRQQKQHQPQQGQQQQQQQIMVSLKHTKRKRRQQIQLSQSQSWNTVCRRSSTTSYLNRLLFVIVVLIEVLHPTRQFVTLVNGQETTVVAEAEQEEQSSFASTTSTTLVEDETASTVLENVAGLQDELSHSNHKDDTVIGGGTTTTTVTTTPPLPSTSSNLKIDNVQLPMGDINILFVTDINGWIASHRHDIASEYHYHSEEEEVYLDADLGNLLSFYQHIKRHCDSLERDLYFVLGGNVHSDHTAYPFDVILDLMKQLPFDVITLGPKDIDSWDKLQMLTTSDTGTDEEVGPTNFVDYWSYKLVTSNLVRPTTTANTDQQEEGIRRRQQPQPQPQQQTQPYFDDTSRFYVLKGEHTGQRILTFSFLLKEHQPDLILVDDNNEVVSPHIEEISNILQMDWFQERIIAGCPTNEQQPQQEHNDAWYDAILILGHVSSDEGDLIINHIHQKLCPSVPIQLLTGSAEQKDNDDESHRGVFTFGDSSSNNNNEEDEVIPSAVMIQGGHNLDTITFVSFPMYTNHNDGSSYFQHEFVDGNTEKLRAILNMDEQSYETFQTPEGTQLSNDIQEISDKLGFNQVLGCSPQRYYTNNSTTSSSLLLGTLYAEQIIPNQLLQPLLRQAATSFGNATAGNVSSSSQQQQDTTTTQIAGMFLQRMSIVNQMLEHDLLEGIITFNDVYNVIPHDEPILEVTMLVQQSPGKIDDDGDNDKDSNDSSPNNRALFSYRTIQQLLIYMKAMEARQQHHDPNNEVVDGDDGNQLLLVVQRVFNDAQVDSSEDEEEVSPSESAKTNADDTTYSQYDQWILYCTESDIDVISNGLKAILQRQKTSTDSKSETDSPVLSIQPVLMIPPSSSSREEEEDDPPPKTIEIDETTTTSGAGDSAIVNTNATSTASIVAVAQEEMGGAPLLVDVSQQQQQQQQRSEEEQEPQPPVITTTRSLFIGYIQQEWGQCHDDMLREEHIEEVTKVASYTIIILILASLCSSCISCGSILVFMSIWCQQTCRRWKESVTSQPTTKHQQQHKNKKLSTKKKKKKRRKHHTTKQSSSPSGTLNNTSSSDTAAVPVMFESVNYDSDVSSIASETSSVASERSFV